jgi:hypothetical protein
LSWVRAFKFLERLIHGSDVKVAFGAKIKSFVQG